ncbi:NADH-quinone oxidoreductase subunit M [Demequina mangrovi]|uniref:NADH dehydrogenase subunit M n=1 Tax=Demequina mangrovi TaxID=1043493 RepID=A0A1H6WB25_9MICO|nr:NADH-quinone oxidoreductase subunit M [Demequina mangrovi]SEJ14168.1 NADH dehydrogenase subunit M [Demequina mangrovi]
MFPILTVMVALPAVGAAVLWALPSGARERVREIALGITVLELALAVALFVQFDTAAAGDIQFSETYSWIPQIGASWALGVNGIGLLMVVLAAILTPLAVLAGWWEDRDADRRTRYLALILLSEAFMVGIFAARDVFLFYVLFEAMLIPLYFLIGSFGGAQRRYAAVKFLLYSLVGGLIMLAGVVALYFQGPGGDEAFLTDNLTDLSMSTSTERLIFLAFFFAFAIKAPMVPVHTWLPTVAENARPGTTALLVAVLDKIGTFGMLTLCVALFPEAAAWAAPVIIVFAVISVVYGGLLAIGQRNMLRLVSFTSVSHFGIMVLGIFAFTQTSVEGAALYMFNHGLSTGALFFAVGFLIHRRGTADVTEYGGLQRVVPVFAGTFLVIGLSALALPGLSPFISEIMVLVGAFSVAKAAVIVSTFGVVLAALYVLLTYQKVFTGPVPEARASFRELTRRERVVLWPLIALMLVLGFLPGIAIDTLSDPAADIVATVPVEEAGQ